MQLDFNEFADCIDDANYSSSDSWESFSEINSDSNEFIAEDDIPTNSNFQKYNPKFDDVNNLNDSWNISDNSTNINEAIESLNSVSVKLKQKLFLKNGASKNVDFDAERIILKIENKRRKITMEICELWRNFISLILISPYTTNRYFESQHYKGYSEFISTLFWKKQLSGLKSIITNFGIEVEENKAEVQRKEYANFKLRDWWFEYSHNNHEYEVNWMPIIFEQDWTPEEDIESSFNSSESSENRSISSSGSDSIKFSSSKDKTKKMQKNNKMHAVFLVHGFQSNYSQLNYLLNTFSRRYPTIEVVSCKSIENKEELGINSLGKLLAKEIIENINSLELYKEIGKISMIGHSMGGLVIRAALRYLKPYKSRMNALITLGSPHLGYLHSNSKIVSAGVWIAKKLSLNRTISEMSLADTTKISETTLYRLSQQKSISWFKTVVMVGSSQDSYGPLESAIIHRSQRIQALANSKIIESMIDNLVENLSKTKFIRLRVNMKISEKSLDSFIGRTAHIQFIDNYFLAKMIIYRFHELFDDS